MFDIDAVKHHQHTHAPTFEQPDCDADHFRGKSILDFPVTRTEFVQVESADIGKCENR